MVRPTPIYPPLADIILNVDNVSQWYGQNRVLHEVDLGVIRGQFVGIVGGSGCGKTTLLRAILGTDPAKEGMVTISKDGMTVPVKGPTRDVGIVYQKYGLYQFLTAQENVAFGLMLDQTELRHRFFMPFFWKRLRKKHLEEAREILERFKLGEALNRYPGQLSGGMQQRVAIAQALVMRPKVLLLDEPFGALDEATRESLQHMLLTLYHENLAAKAKGQQPNWTVLIVTHELNEAFYVCDRVVALSRNWIDEKNTGKVCGATKVWDKCAPIYHPDAPRDFGRFFELKNQLKTLILDGKAPSVERHQHVTFWSELRDGVATGIATTGSRT